MRKRCFPVLFVLLAGCAGNLRIANPIARSERLSLEIEAGDLSMIAPDVLAAVAPIVAPVLSPKSPAVASISSMVNGNLPLILPGRASTVFIPAPPPTAAAAPPEAIRPAPAVAPEPAVPRPAAAELTCYLNPGGAAWHRPDCRFVKPDAVGVPCSVARATRRPCRTCGGDL